MLAGKKILIAVTGSIAAYKTAFFVRLLVKAEAEVKVIMTTSAKQFVAPLTFSTLSQNPVNDSFVKNESGEWTNHVELGLWADLLIVAPASANTIAKMANGICDNLLLATYLSARCPVMVAPAMDLDMYQHPSTQSNLSRLEEFGHTVLNVEHGELASGLTGKGRMMEPETLLERVEDHFRPGVLSKKKILITSGPTFEPIDAVRFIGNRSSGKMGRALAEEFVRHDAHVIFITGPSGHLPQHPSIEIIPIQSAEEMLEKAKTHHPECDIAVFAAAVSDYRPKKAATQKLKRNGEVPSVELVENPDIALELGNAKKENQFHVGFALETHDEEANARTKLKKKNFDFIVLNSLQNEGAGFNHDTNRITIYTRDNKSYPYELSNKTQVARDIVSLLISNLA